jgi:hypothetical protein
MIGRLKIIFNEYRRVRNVRKAIYKNKIVVELNDDEQELIDQLKRFGFVVIPDYYTKEKCAIIRAEIDKLIESNSEYLWVDEKKSDHRIYGAEQLSAIIKEFHDDPFLLKLAEAFNEVPIINSHTLVGKIVAVMDNLGSGQGWHRDSASPFQFKALIYVSNACDVNGPFQYLIGSNKVKSLFQQIWNSGMKVNHTRFREKDIEQIQKSGDYKIHTLTANAGSLVLVNTFGIHRGKPIEQGYRYALTNYYMNKHNYDLAFMSKKFNLPKKSGAKQIL